MGGLLLLRKLALEMTFNIFTTKRVSCFGQYDRIDDLITCKLSGDKCPVFQQFLVDEFHFSAVFKCLDPLFVWHFRIFFRRDQGMSRVYVVRCQKSRMGNEKSPSRDPAFERWTENYNGELPLPRVSTQRPELRRLAKLIVKTVQFGPAEPFFPSLWCICRGDEQSQRRALFWPLGKETMEYDFMINNPIPKLRKAPQPPLAHPRATPDSDRAKRPPLAEPSATDQELNPGDRVEGLGNFGKPTGELGTVEQANEDDAVVKWDDDGRMRLSQPWLKKV